MTLSVMGVTCCDKSFQVLESCEIDSAVRKHADESHGKAAVEGTKAGCGPHLASCCDDESVAVETAFNSFTLHATRVVKLVMALRTGRRARLWPF